MAIKIAISNQKGGVGKTTTAINIADGLRHIGKRVLFIDMDPQCNSTTTYGAVIENENTIVDVLKKDCEIREAIQKTPMGEIIAGDTLLVQMEYYFYSQKARENILRRVLKEIENDYDFIIMDTPPNLGIYMINALTAADGIIIPLPAQAYSIDGLSLLIDTIKEIRETLNDNLKIYGVLLTSLDIRRSMDVEVRDVIPLVGEQKGFSVFKTPIRVCQDIQNVQGLKNKTDQNGNVQVVNRSLFDRYPTCNGAIDYVNVIKELLEVI